MERRNFIKETAMAVGAGMVSLPGFVSASKTDHFDESIALDGNQTDWTSLQKQFALSPRRVYFNNGTLGPCPRTVVEALFDRLSAQVTLGEYQGRNAPIESLSILINAQPDEICLTHNTTEGINLVASGLPLSQGDEIVMTTHEHVGNAVPWLNRAQESGLKIVPVVPKNSAEENLIEIESKITAKTKVVAIPHITCTTGHVYPIREISELCRNKGILSFIDGAHGPGMMMVDVLDIGCDFYASCGHKWLLGPAGTGFLYIKKDNLDLLEVHHAGAYSDKAWKISETEQSFGGYVDSAGRFYYGTQSAALMAGLDAAVNFHLEIGPEKIQERVKELSEYLYSGLAAVNGKIELLSSSEADSRSGMIGFRPLSMDFKAFGDLALENAFRIRQVPESDLNSIRVSVHIYNSFEQIDSFISMVETM